MQRYLNRIVNGVVTYQKTLILKYKRSLVVATGRIVAYSMGDSLSRPMETSQMLKILNESMRFFGMWAPSESMRLAMYRKAGIRIGKVHAFGSGIWLDDNFKNIITIEDDVHLSGYIRILSHSYILYGYEKEGISPVVIKKGARIGNNVLILAGVTIGENSVVGAGAVVANDIPPNCLAAGVPAKPVRYFTSNKMLQERNDRMALKLPLYIKCKTCGIEFWSDIRCDEKTFNTLNLRGNSHVCPNRHKNRYDKEDYYYVDIMERVIRLCAEWKEGEKNLWIAKLAKYTFVSTRKILEDYLKPLITNGILENGLDDTIRFVGFPNGFGSPNNNSA